MKSTFSMSGVFLAISAIAAVLILRLFVLYGYPVLSGQIQAAELMPSLEFMAVVATLIVAGFAGAVPRRYPSQGGIRTKEHLLEFLHPSFVVGASALALMTGVAVMMKFNTEAPELRMTVQFTALALNLAMVGYCYWIIAKASARFTSSNRMYEGLRYIDSSSSD